MSHIKVLLPERIFILKSLSGQGVVYDKEEYSIYYKNIIAPYSEDYDIQIECKYGKNLGDCWRIDSFDTESDVFDFSLKIYGEEGELLAEKSCIIELLDKKEHKKTNLLCIGDSMTRAEIYLKHAAEKVTGINTVGLRNISYGVNHEGRGGWASYSYFTKKEDTGSGVSPFLFPKGFGGKEYFGSKRFWENVSEYSENYHYAGIKPQKIADGMVCLDDGKLWRYSDGKYKLIDKEPEFEFDFGKYIERYDIPKPDIVSFLFGANEFQICRYAELDAEIEKYIKTLKAMIENVRNFDKNIKIVVNMPICGGSQYAWGTQMGCVGTAKQYDFNIKKACDAILREFDGRWDENIFVCPMLAVCDTVSGFPHEYKKVNVYSDLEKRECTNWVHPCEVGYKQMGDAFAAVIAAVIN